jgi:hypothetical protein
MQASDKKTPKSSELQERRTEFGLVYIVYVRFGRRGEGVKSLRRILGLQGRRGGCLGRYMKLLVRYSTLFSPIGVSDICDSQC